MFIGCIVFKNTFIHFYNETVSLCAIKWINIGQYLVERILEHPELELAFVWTRRSAELRGGRVDERLVLHSLDDIADRSSLSKRTKNAA